MKSFAFAAALVAAVQAVAVESSGYGSGHNAGYGHQQSYTYPVAHTQHRPANKVAAASKAYGADYQKASASDWDAWGRDQDLSISESYGKTNAKSYAAESYDEWDNKDDDRWGAQAWGQDRDGAGASSYGKAASASDADQYAYGAKSGYGPNPHGAKAANGAAAQKWQGASASYGAAQNGYDNDVWAKQAYGTDTDSRWGKSYDSVDAKSYDGEWYAKSVKADDDQWAEDYDRYDSGDADSYGRAASTEAWKNGDGHYNKGGDYKAASAKQGAGYWGKSGSDWDSWGRDQDYSEDVSYDKVQAKAYAAESYDEWDNQDADKWGAQAWGKDTDVYGASSYGAKASAQDWQGAGYGAKAGYGASDSYGVASKGGQGYSGSKHGGYGGHGSAYGSNGYAKGASGSQHAAAGQAGYGQATSDW